MHKLAATPLPPLAAVLANADGWLLAFIVTVVRTVSALPFARIDLVPPSVSAIVAYDALAVLAALAIHRGRYGYAAVAIGVAVLLVLLPRFPSSGTLRIDAIDVGQADALILRTPSGHAIMIDTGGKLERGTDEESGGSPAEAVGERIVVPTLLRAGVRELDGLIITHPHGDHKGVHAHKCGPLILK